MNSYKRNDEITFHRIKVVLPDVEGVQEMSKSEAMQIALEKWEDLIMISPTARPPICKIMDYWQFLYEQKKKTNQKHKNNKKSEVKWIRLTFNIGQHDFDIKLKKAREFLEDKDFVKITMQFKWRELSHSELWLEKVKAFAEELSDISKPEQDAEMSWRQINLLLIPIRKQQ